MLPRMKPQTRTEWLLSLCAKLDPDDPLRIRAEGELLARLAAERNDEEFPHEPSGVFLRQVS